MDHTFSKLIALDSSEKLLNARFPSNTCAGGVLGEPEYTPLVAPSAAPEVVNAVAKHLGLLKTSYANAKSPKISTSAAQDGVRQNRGVVPSHMFRAKPGEFSSFSILGFLGDIWDHVTMAAGDLVRALKHAVEGIVHGVEHVAKIVYDGMSDTLHFLVQIGETVYHAVLDTVDAVVGAMEWVFKVVKTTIEDIINFVRFLFEWDDIRRTKDVLHNLVGLWVQHQADKAPLVRDSFDKAIAGVEGIVNKMAGVVDWSPLRPDMQKPVAASAFNPLKGQTSGSQMLVNHYRDHAHQLRILGVVPEKDGVVTLIEDLLTAIANEGVVLEGVLKQLQKIASEFSSLSVVDILKRLMAILVGGVLSSVQAVVDALLNVLSHMAHSVVNLLHTNIHIPIISDILKLIGVPGITFLDLFSWIIAVAYTVAYKIANGHPSFPSKDDTVSAMISAKTFDEISSVFGQQGRGSSNFNSSSLHSMQASPRLITIPKPILTAIFLGSHAMAGLGGFVLSILTGPEAEFPTGENRLATPCGVVALIAGAIHGIGEFLCPRAPIENEAVSICSDIVLGLFTINKGVFSGIAQKILRNKTINKKINLSGMAVKMLGVSALFVMVFLSSLLWLLQHGTLPSSVISPPEKSDLKPSWANARIWQHMFRGCPMA